MTLPPIEEIQKIGERISSRLGHMFQQVERLARSLDEQEKTLRDLSARVGVLERFGRHSPIPPPPAPPPAQPIRYVGRPVVESRCLTCKRTGCPYAGSHVNAVLGAMCKDWTGEVPKENCLDCKDSSCTWAGKNLRRSACPAWKGGT